MVPVIVGFSLFVCLFTHSIRHQLTKTGSPNWVSSTETERCSSKSSVLTPILNLSYNRMIYCKQTAYIRHHTVETSYHAYSPSLVVRD